MNAARTFSHEFAADVDVPALVRSGQLGRGVFRIEAQDSKGWVARVTVVASGDEDEPVHQRAPAGTTCEPPPLMVPEVAQPMPVQPVESEAARWTAQRRRRIEQFIELHRLILENRNLMLRLVYSM